MVSRRGILLALLATPFAGAAFGGSPAGSPWLFTSIDGGTLDLADFRGGPVLVVNTASRCGFTHQYDGLQALWERYRDRGLTVVGVPSRSFGQELDSAEAVKDFCEVNFALDFPMTGLVEVRGPQAHPFYQWAAAGGEAPDWNFHKILIDGDGRIVAGFDRHTEPDDPRLVASVEALLPERAGR
jgi:glutathione peroxidase